MEFKEGNTPIISLNQNQKKRSSKKQLYIAALFVLLVLLGVIGFVFVKSTKKDATGSSVTSNSKDHTVPVSGNDAAITPEPPKPVFVASPVNGIMLEQKAFDAIKDRPVLAVMIQNNTASRPEWGLNDADVVYETLAEGGITRFMGIFWSKDVAKLQSLRSARKYFVELTGDYKTSVYMHIGQAEGDDDVSAVNALARYKIKDLANYGGAFDRDHTCEKTRATEHCAFSSTAKLWEIASKNKWNDDVTKVESLKFKDKTEESKSNGKALTDFKIDFLPSLGGTDYSVRWKYDAEAKVYKRFNVNNTPYVVDGNTQVQSDVIVYQKITSYPKGDHKSHQVQEVIGSGTGYVMQDGKVYPVKWSKPNYATRTKFTDAVTGEEFVFNRGKLWMTLVPKSNEYIDLTPTPTPTATAIPTKTVTQ